LWDQYSVKAVDPTRLVFDMTARGLSGVALDDLLREKYGIQMEMSDTHRVVACRGLQMMRRILKISECAAGYRKKFKAGA